MTKISSPLLLALLQISRGYQVYFGFLWWELDNSRNDDGHLYFWSLPTPNASQALAMENKKYSETYFDHFIFVDVALLINAVVKLVREKGSLVALHKHSALLHRSICAV